MDAADLVIVTVLVGIVLYLASRATVYWRQRCGNLGLEQRLAQDRAEALLRDILTVAEYTQLGEYGYLEVRSPSQPRRTYRVPRRPGRVAVHEGDVEVESLCVAPIEWLPAGDIVLAHKLMIEGNEQEYLRRANHIRLRSANRMATHRS